MEKIVKIADNNVEVYRSKSVEASDGKTVEVYVDSPESYGENRVSNELKLLDAQECAVHNYDKNAQLAKIAIKRNLLLSIQAKLREK